MSEKIVNTLRYHLIQKLLPKIIGVLSDRGRDVVNSRYGLGSEKKNDPESIGKNTILLVSVFAKLKITRLQIFESLKNMKENIRF